MKKVIGGKKSGAPSGGGDGRGTVPVIPSTIPTGTPNFNVDSDTIQPQTQENENEVHPEEGTVSTGKIELHPHRFW